MTIEAGRKLDALVAEKVMGKQCICPSHQFSCPIHELEDLPDYSTSIAAAWQIVERFRRGQHGGVACVVELHITDNPVEKDSSCRIFGPDTKEGYAEATEMPEAICLAALKAVGHE